MDKDEESYDSADDEDYKPSGKHLWFVTAWPSGIALASRACTCVSLQPWTVQKMALRPFRREFLLN